MCLLLRFATVDVPAQGISIDYAKEGAMAVVFFVADVRTAAQSPATESNVWKASLDKCEEQALSMSKSQQVPQTRPTPD